MQLWDASGFDYRVLPDTSRFTETLKARLDEIEAKLKVEIPTSLDLSGVTKDLAALRAELNKGAGKVTIKVDVDAKDVATKVATAAKAASAETKVKVTADTDAVLAEVKAAAKVASATTAKVKVGVAPDTSSGSKVDAFARAVNKDLRDAVNKVEMSIPVSPEGEGFRRKLATLITATERSLSVDVPLDVHKAAAWRTKVVAQVAEIEALVRTLDPKIDLVVSVDRDRIGAARKVISDTLGNLQALSVSRLAQISAVVGQVRLVASRAAAYVALLGPPIVLAASGALALAPSLATSLPILGAMGAAVGVIVLGMDSLFGQKANGKRAGGLFEPLRQEILATKGDIGDLLTAGLDPLVERLRTGTFTAFTGGMKDVAGAVNVAFHSLLDFGVTAEAQRGTAAVFAAITSSLTELGRTTGPVARALLQISVGALPGFRALNGFIADTLLRFTGFINRAAQSGQLTRVISQSVNDLIAFLSQLGRIVSALIEFLAVLEPAARAVFSAIGNGAEQGLRALSDALQNFKISDTIFAPLLTGIATFIGAIRLIPSEIVRALAPLVTSNEFATFVTNLGSLVLSLSLAFAEFARQAIGVAGGLLQIVGIPIVGVLGGLLGALAGIADRLRNFDGLITVVAAGFTLKLLPAIQAAIVRGLTALGAAILPAILAFDDFVLAIVRTSVAVVTRFIPALLSAAAGAIASFVTAMLSVVLSLAGADAGMLTTAGATTRLGASMAVMSGEAAGVRASLAGLTAGVAIFQAVLTGGILIAITGVIGGLAAWQQAQDKAKQSIGDLTAGFDVFDQTGAQKTIDGLRGIAEESVKVGEKTSTLAKGFELFKKGVLFGIPDTPIADAAARGLEAAKAMAELNKQTANYNANVKLIGASANLSTDQVIALAKAGNIKLTGDPKDSADARQRVIDQLDLIRIKTGLTAAALVTAAGPATAAWSQFAEAISAAVKAAQSSFTSQTDIIAAFKPDTGAAKAVKATTKQIADSQTAVARANEAVQAKAAALETRRQKGLKITATQMHSLAAAQDRLTAAQKKAEDTKAGRATTKTSAAAVPVTLEATYKKLVAQASAFTTNIDEAIRRGLDPQLVVRLLQAGPQQAAPVLQAILTDHTGRLLKIANDAEKALREVNTRVLEQTRLVAIATASGSDQLVKDLNNGLKISQQNAVLGAKGTAEAIAQALNIPVEEVARIAAEFGISLTNSIQDAVDRHPINVKGTVSVINNPSSRTDQLRNIKGLRDGGLVRGPGTARSDSIPAWLSNLEFVQPAHVVSHYGVEVMEALRARAIPRSMLQMLASGQGIAPKLVAAMPPPPAPRAVRSGVVAQPVGGEHHSRTERGDGPVTMTLVDRDGVVMGAFEAYLDRHERRKLQRERLGRLAGRR